METSCFDLAARFIGLTEIPGATANPQILAMLRLDGSWPADDAVPWCSAFTNYIAWLLRLPRSKSLAARSWLEVGRPIALGDAGAANDVVILSRDGGGHVAFYAGNDKDKSLVQLLGGNQANQVNVASFSRSRVIGVRRLVGL